MTTTVMAHLPKDQKKRLLIETFDRAYGTEAWTKTDYVFVDAGALYQTYCTDTRRVLISEVPLAED